MQIDDSVQKAVGYLYSIQKNGLWEVAADDELHKNFVPAGMHYGGYTALATYALLASGEHYDDPRLATAIKFLKGLQTRSVYVIGVRAQIWSYFPKNDITKILIARDEDLLIQAVQTRGEGLGLFRYPNGYPDVFVRDLDTSISQFGVLGLWAGVRGGAEVPEQLWTVMDHAWRAHQSQAGGWAYCPVSQSVSEHTDSLAMTSAGVASLLIISDYLDHTTNEAGSDPNIDRGLKWIGSNFSLLYANDSRDSNVRYYALYGLERLGVAGGYKYIGDVNWFASGSDFLLRNQNSNGSWGTPGDMWTFNAGNVPDTCFGMLFFINGHARVVINKLSYTNKETNETFLWNERPRDIANLTSWAGKKIESLLNWQIVTIAAPLRDLHDGAILYLSGDKPLTFTSADTDKLRQFVEEGGMILANANLGNHGFGESIRNLGATLFPNYGFRALPADHPIYTNEQFPRQKFITKPTVLGLSNGVRELFLLIPDSDASRAWQSQRASSDLFPLGADIIQYATDRIGLDEAPLPYFVEPEKNVMTRRSATVARLEYDGNWNPEPGGWRRLTAIMHNQYQMDLKVVPLRLGNGELSSAPTPPPARSAEELRKAAFSRIPSSDVMATGGDQKKLDALIDQRAEQILAKDAANQPVAQARFQLAHLTGTAAFHLNEVSRDEIRKFISGSGTLVVDAAGGLPAFATAAESELSAIFGPDVLEAAIQLPLAGNDPLYKLPVATISSVAYRTFAKRELGNLKAPRLCGIVKGGRIVVYYSREDLSAGLVGEQVDGIRGYTPDAATEIMRNIVLRAAKVN